MKDMLYAKKCISMCPAAVGLGPLLMLTLKVFTWKFNGLAIIVTFPRPKISTFLTSQHLGHRQLKAQIYRSFT